MATTKSKKTDAKSKVEELLKDVVPKKKAETQKVSVEEKKSMKWLEGELERLTQENENLSGELETTKAEFKKLFESTRNQPKAMTETDVTKGVRELFIELENAYLGRNPQNIKYTDTKIKVQLDNMLSKFPFLLPKK